jgi:hypothetical protein
VKCGLDLSPLTSGACITSAVRTAITGYIRVKRKDPYEDRYTEWETGEIVRYTVDTETIMVYTQYDCKRCIGF